jgi:hypothetical protein
MYISCHWCYRFSPQPLEQELPTVCLQALLVVVGLGVPPRIFKYLKGVIMLIFYLSNNVWHFCNVPCSGNWYSRCKNTAVVYNYLSLQFSVGSYSACYKL